LFYPLGYIFNSNGEIVLEIRERLEELIDSELAMIGYELVKLEASFAGRRKVLRIFIDRMDRAVTIDDCVEVTKIISLVLDAEDMIPGPYTLEVSSPGVDRPLTKPEHFKRFIGRTARVEYQVEDGKVKMTGEIVDADDSGFSLKHGEEEVRIGYGMVVKANLKAMDLDFPKGSGGKSKR